MADGMFEQAGAAAGGLTGLAGRRGVAGRLTRRIVRREQAGQQTGMAQARLGRVLARRQARQTDMGRAYDRRTPGSYGSRVMARGQRFISRTARR